MKLIKRKPEPRPELPKRHELKAILREIVTEASIRQHAEVKLVGLNELQKLNRWEIERRSRALSHPLYLGDHLALCRVLGRYKLYCDTRDVGFVGHVLFDGFWEPWLTTFIIQRVRPGMVVADIGANHGYYTVLMADLIGGGGRIAAFEPNPAVFALLEKSVNLNGFAGRASLFAQAVGADESGTVTLIIPRNETKNARVGDVMDAAASDEVVEVPSGSLADALIGWPRLDFLKVDVEGAEENVVRGALSRLASDKPTMVLEYHASRCHDPKALLDSLIAIYGRVRVIEFDGQLHEASLERLLDPSPRDDWLLCLD
jgi:FkbM family methyltransferase